MAHVPEQPGEAAETGEAREDPGDGTSEPDMQGEERARDERATDPPWWGMHETTGPT